MIFTKPPTVSLIKTPRLKYNRNGECQIYTMSKRPNFINASNIGSYNLTVQSIGVQRILSAASDVVERDALSLKRKLLVGRIAFTSVNYEQSFAPTSNMEDNLIGSSFHIIIVCYVRRFIDVEHREWILLASIQSFAAIELIVKQQISPC